MGKAFSQYASVIALAGATLMLPCAARAQEGRAGASEPDGQAAASEEIVVTAQRRAERAVDVTDRRYLTAVQYTGFGIGSNWSKPATYGVEFGINF